MLRDALTVLLGLLALLALGVHEYRLALLLVLATLVQLVIRKNATHQVLQRQQNYLAVQLIRGFILGLILIALAIALTPISRNDGTIFGITLAIALLPLGLWLPKAVRKNHAKQLLAEHNAIKAFRSTFTLNLSAALLATAAFAGLAWFHVALAIQPVQLVLFGTASLLAMRALQSDPAGHKLTKLPVHEIDADIYSWRSLAAYNFYGVLAAAAAYVNYLFLFARHQLSPLRLDPNLPLYQQATTLTFLTLLGCSFITVLMERADKHDQFFAQHLHSNPRLVKTFGISLVILAGCVYLPGLQSLFKFQPLSFTDWLSAIFFTGLYTLCRLLQRHTRKHTRHAVVKLHHEVHQN